jgi:hypothetical protein
MHNCFMVQFAFLHITGNRFVLIPFCFSSKLQGLFRKVEYHGCRSLAGTERPFRRIYTKPLSLIY